MANESIWAALEVLGLRADATSQQVKDAFHDLAQVWHPDRFAHNPRLLAQAEAKMKELNQANAVLRDYFTNNKQPECGADSGIWSYTRSGFPEDTSSNGERGFASTTWGTANWPPDEVIATVRCPYCMEVRRAKLPDGWVVLPLTVRCRQCRKSFEPVQISDPPASHVVKEDEVDLAIVPWHKDPILKYAWRIPTAILVVFFLFISRHLISYAFQQIVLFITNVAMYLYNNAGFLFIYFILLPLGVVSLMALVFVAVREEARRRALATKCPLCGKLSALRCVGENIVSQTPRPKTVTRTSTGAAFLDGQLIPAFRSDRVQIIVYDVVFRYVYNCKFCREDSHSGLLHREVEP
jgi:DnaJ domain